MKVKSDQCCQNLFTDNKITVFLSDEYNEFKFCDIIFIKH